MSPDAARIIADLRKHKRFADLTDGDAGKDLCKVATDGVQATLAAQRAPDGTGWDELSEAYARWKSAHYPGKPMGVLNEIMAAPDQVAGEIEVIAELAIVSYGTKDEARQHAEWFGVKRPFWGFTEESLKATAELLDKRSLDYMRG